MKKKYFTCLAMLACAFSLSAQSYDLKVRTETYTELTSPTLLSGAVPWDDDSWMVSIPFDFNFFGASFDELVVLDGYAYFTEDGGDLVGIFDNDLMDAGLVTSESPVSYQVTGSAPNRILKVQWKNAHFFEDDTAEDSANFQFWLYEGSHKIEMHYGPTSVKNSDSYGATDGAIVYLLDTSGQYFINLTDDPANPTVVTNITSSETLNGHPVNGTVYEFTVKPGTGIPAHPMSTMRLKAYPNPMSEVLTVQLPSQGNKKVQILDVTGRTVAETETSEDRLLMPVAGLAKGAYLLKVSVAGEDKLLKLVK